MLSKKISSLQHDIVKRARKLRENAPFRKQEGAAILSGAKILSELAHHLNVLRIFQKEGKKPLPIKAHEIIEVTEEILQKITGQPTPDGYAAEVSLPKMQQLFGKRLLALDSIQDPSNLGAIFRSAYAFSIDIILLLPGCADPFHERAIQAARGVQFLMPFTHVSTLPQYPLFGAALDGTPLTHYTFPEKYILVLGNEGHGLSTQIEKRCKKIAIPIQRVDSLNVSVAAGIFLYELSRNS